MCSLVLYSLNVCVLRMYDRFRIRSHDDAASSDRLAAALSFFVLRADGRPHVAKICVFYCVRMCVLMATHFDVLNTQRAPTVPRV